MAAAPTVDFPRALGRFGLSAFRKGQHEVIQHVIHGHDCLCVMPTGGGKSLCYQLPSVIRPGLTIVVSPLIALMKDQVDTLVRRGISATLINSTLSVSEQNQRLDHVAGGHYSLVYVAPERLRNSKFLDAIRSTPVQLLAIDEAHCISEWGHDFRPDYQRLGKFREALGGVQTIALTATATPRVRQDIVDSLKLKVAKHFITGFARDNLFFGSMSCMGDRDKDSQLIEFLQKQSGTGIVYAATRKRCEGLVEMISKEVKISVGAYHAGLMPEQRKLIQDQFMKNELKVIVATNAFGMGIDKSDLRYVVHYNIPGTLEAYYQEAGRAGRDGKPSQCMLLYSSQDRYIQEFFIENANPSKELLQLVYEFLVGVTDDPIELTSEEIRDASKAPTTAEAINSCLQILGRTSVMERLEVAGGLAMFRISSKLPTLVDLLPRDANVRRSVLRTLEKAIGDRRDEAVYIHPRWLMQQLQMDRDALNRNLRELCKLDCFEYVPPFRGRAIHFRRRDVSFDDLKIDHETLAARKKSDYEKLDRMVAYAQSRHCRQKTILDYFGDASAQKCGICDRCQGKTGWPTMPEVVATDLPTPSVATSIAAASIESPLDPAQKESTAVSTLPVEKKRKKNAIKPMEQDEASEPTAESTQQASELIMTIMRAVERTHGYLSKTLLTQHLQGIENKAIQGLRLQRLAEFGLLRDWKKSHSSGLLDIALDEGLLSLSTLRANKVTVCVSEFGLECLASKKPLPTRVVRFACLALDSTLPISDRNGEPVARSRSATPDETQNNQQSKEQSKSRTPAGSIPKTTEPVHVEQDRLAGVLMSKDDQSSSEPSDVRFDSPRPSEGLPVPRLQDAQQNRDPLAPMMEDWRWTIRLVQHGYRLGEIALIRGKTPDGVLEDLSKAVRDRVRFSIETLFDRRTQIAIREIMESTSIPASPPPVFQSYPSLWRFIEQWLRHQ
jgi:ATP-dependent DNA helicase RecQ